jgi:hypothetical protein
MRKLLIFVGFAAASALLASAAPAAAQGFGQVTFGAAPAAPAPPADAAKAAGRDLDGVTVTSKRLPDSQKDPTEVVCHDETPIGTRFPKKVCATRRQSSERKMADQEQLYEWTLGKPLKGN